MGLVQLVVAACLYSLLGISSNAYISSAQPIRRYDGLNVPITTTRHMKTRTSRRLRQETYSEREQLWVLGLDQSQQGQVHNSLESCGGSIKSALPPSGPHEDHHWVVASTAACMEAILAEHQEVTVAPLPAQAKISSVLAQVMEKESSSREEDNGNARAFSMDDYLPSEMVQQVDLYALCPGVSISELQELQLQLHGQLMRICSCTPSWKVTSQSLFVSLCQQDVSAATQVLSTAPSITYVGISQPMKANNLHASAAIQQPSRSVPLTDGPPKDLYTGIDSGFLPLWQSGITGKGQVVGIIDSGIDMDSCYFYEPGFDDYQTGNYTTKQPSLAYVPGNALTAAGHLYGPVSELPDVTVFQTDKHRKVAQYVFYSDAYDHDGHGTHTSGTIVGSAYGFDPLKEPSVATGVAPMAKVAMFDVGRKGSEYMEVYVGQDYGQIYEVQRQGGARVTSNSWGTASGFQYGAPECYLMDGYTWAVDDMLHVFAAGNDGADLIQAATTGTVSSPASCKNVLSVAATQSWTINGTDNNRKPITILDRSNDTLDDMATYKFAAPGTGSLDPAIMQGSMVFTVPSGKTVARLNGYSLEIMAVQGYNSSFVGLKDMKMKVMMVNPEDGCQAVEQRFTDMTGPILVLVKKTSTSSGGCLSKTTLTNIQGTGAAAIVMFWTDDEAVASSAKGFAGVPSATITRTAGNRVWKLLSSNVDVYAEFRAGPGSPYENIAWFSSFASAADYRQKAKPEFNPDTRFKPEISAPGYLYSAYSDGKFSGQMDQCQAVLMKGTSMAAPVVAGSAALARQYLLDGFYPSGAQSASCSHDPSGPLLKALLLAGTAAMTGVSDIDSQPLQPPPSPYQGFGRLDLSASLPLASNPDALDMQFVDGERFTRDGVEHTYEVEVTNSSKPFVVTLVWHDYPAFPGNRYVLVNNLDLIVDGPIVQDADTSTTSATRYWGNSRKGGDYHNNVEKVSIQSPDAGRYRITIRSVYLFWGARPQKYALVVLGGFDGVLDSLYNPATAQECRYARQAQTFQEAGAPPPPPPAAHATSQLHPPSVSTPSSTSTSYPQQMGQVESTFAEQQMLETSSDQPMTGSPEWLDTSSEDDGAGLSPQVQDTPSPDIIPPEVSFA